MYPLIPISSKADEYKGIAVTFMRIVDRFAWKCDIDGMTYGDFVTVTPVGRAHIEANEAQATAELIKQQCYKSIDAILNRGNDGGFNDGKGGGEPEPKPDVPPTGGNGIEVEKEPILSPFCMAVAGGVVALPN